MSRIRKYISNNKIFIFKKYNVICLFIYIGKRPIHINKN